MHATVIQLHSTPFLRCNRRNEWVGGRLPPNSINPHGHSKRPLTFHTRAATIHWVHRRLQTDTPQNQGYVPQAAHCYTLRTQLENNYINVGDEWQLLSLCVGGREPLYSYCSLGTTMQTTCCSHLRLAHMVTSKIQAATHCNVASSTQPHIMCKYVNKYLTDMCIYYVICVCTGVWQSSPCHIRTCVTCLVSVFLTTELECSWLRSHALPDGHGQEVSVAGSGSRQCFYDLSPNSQYEISHYSQLQGLEGPAVTTTDTTRTHKNAPLSDTLTHQAVHFPFPTTEIIHSPLNLFSIHDLE